MKHLIPCMLLCALACTTPETRPDPAPDMAVCIPDAFGRAEVWARDEYKTGSEVTKTWSEAHVLRMWRADGFWYALVGPKKNAQDGAAVRLTLQRAQFGWKVIKVEPAQATDLWPSLGG